MAIPHDAQKVETPLPAPWISPRMMWGLGSVALAHGALIGATVWDPLPAFSLSDIFRVDVLPAGLAALAVGLGLLLAPLWAQERPDGSGAGRRPRNELAWSLFLGLWQGSALGFFLLAASRLTPLENGPLLRCLLVVTFSAAAAVLAARRFPRAYAGVVFLIAVGLPTACFVLSEIFLAPTGALSWHRVPGAEAAAIRTFGAWLFSLSPGSAAVGAVQGRLVSGDAFGWKETGRFALLYGACLVFLLNVKRKR